MTVPRRRPWWERQTHSWTSIVEFFAYCAEGNPYFAPLHQFGVRLAESRYASGVFPVQSMHSVRLYQNGRYTDVDPFIHVRFEHGKFTVVYIPGASRPRLLGTPAEWSRRGEDGFGILEGCFRHLGWFVEYRVAGDVAASSEPSEAHSL
jgi:hypothetical protein